MYELLYNWSDGVSILTDLNINWTRSLRDYFFYNGLNATMQGRSISSIDGSGACLNICTLTTVAGSYINSSLDELFLLPLVLIL